ncbi:MAG: haloalkane dehalogenase, partial [Solirubrobacteraceae bacterium]
KAERQRMIISAVSYATLPTQFGEGFAAAMGGPAPRPIADASHFLQEDQGAMIGGQIAGWLTGS